MQIERDVLIRQHIYAHGHSSIQDLSRVTGASAATIRRDLQRLEEEGVLVRTHGGATLTDSAGPEVAFQAREQQDLEAKRAVADAAFGRLRPRTAVFFDAGTTVLQLARRLRLTPLPLTVFTNGLAVAQELTNLPDIKVNLLGGQIRDENLSLVGPIAERQLGDLWFDQLFLGTSAVKLDGQLYTQDAAEAALNRRMIERAAQKYLLADASKFGRSATYAVGGLHTFTEVITSQGLEDHWTQRLAELRVHLVSAPHGRSA